MNSIHRVGLTIATVAAVATVAGAFAVQSYVAAGQPTSRATAQMPQATASPAPEIVYISAVQAAPTASPAQQPPVIHVVVPGHGDGAGEHEGSDN